MVDAAKIAIAEKLRAMVDVLEQQHAGCYRFIAYRRAARTFEQHDWPIEELVRSSGLAGIVELPGIGRLGDNMFELPC